MQNLIGAWGQFTVSQDGRYNRFHFVEMQSGERSTITRIELVEGLGTRQTRTAFESGRGSQRDEPASLLNLETFGSYRCSGSTRGRWANPSLRSGIDGRGKGTGENGFSGSGKGASRVVECVRSVRR